ncbi:phenylacetyl CoA [Treponema primitia ZAS-2]|uniref:FdhD n=1 Tax=Treponema primitia (strain ATCC BAA-887 / DSM 12427 / ZAS-2) TaxID=545694 RepID=D8L152_TREPZ|nr:formate dehydrogenase accessory sulfurtransferase FdhD [Treponema primitia]ADJ19596.1 putative formate dehydrogenase accessory protein chain D [Treponema primitia ZAS-2]AEF84576.1 phenylacetyl CoA [Treponema primitia ZAS-2]AEL20845.1 FdhD [Treponema primitia ZAS-2]
MSGREQGAACWEERDIVRIDATGRHRRIDRVIKEEPCTLFINGEQVNIFACCPADLEELAVGYAFSKGYFRDKKEIEALSIDSDSVSLSIRNSGTVADADTRVFPEEISLSPDDIYAVWESFNAQCELFQATGAAHAMALTDGKQILLFAEDVARHNALAKLIGKIILGSVDPRGKILLISSRLALEMFRMIESLGLAVLLCHGAVSAGAVRKAEEAGITLAGFVGRAYMNIYSHGERITGVGAV